MDACKAEICEAADGKKADNEKLRKETSSYVISCDHVVAAAFAVQFGCKSFVADSEMLGTTKETCKKVSKAELCHKVHSKR